MLRHGCSTITLEPSQQPATPVQHVFWTRSTSVRDVNPFVLLYVHIVGLTSYVLWCEGSGSADTCIYVPEQVQSDPRSHCVRISAIRSANNVDKRASGKTLFGTLFL